jgi:hypothetical protein
MMMRRILATHLMRQVSLFGTDGFALLASANFKLELFQLGN